MVGRVLPLFLRTGPLWPLRERGQSVHVLNGKQEGAALSVCPGPPRLRLLYRYGVCVAGAKRGEAAGETGFLGHSLLITGPEALWQVG